MGNRVVVPLRRSGAKKPSAFGDKAKAVALAIAERKLNARGEQWDAKELGRYAAEILLSMNTALENRSG